jgi:malonyl-CoA O-methyltransferase
MKKAIIRDFDKAAKSYDEHAKVQRIIADKLFAMGEFNAQQIVLDAGCGTGYFHELLRKNKIYCPLVQADISPNMCKIAAEYASSKEYGGTYTINEDIANLPIENNIIDVVFSSMTLQWTEDLTATFTELHRVLKKGGKIIFSTVGDGSLHELDKSFANIDDNTHINQNFQTEDTVRESLAAAGFNNISLTSENITENFSDVMAIMRSIKGVGANYKGGGKYLGKQYFAMLEQEYKSNYGNQHGLPLSWNIIFGVATK